MVNQTEKQKLDSLLRMEIITPAEYEKLLKRAETEEKSVIGTIFKTLLTIILTILAVIAIVFGVCFILVVGF
jgi:hypothetical protein